ncbi:DUF943 family protein [Pseudomonas knackmussii]|uniref:DUF943 family protein n=1 Tax=Pseudomonas knackmussii TaxID=65741 RepID=UPI001363EAD2|nr:DUF943 family protein [Pseudomonas knackmussii]
MTRGFLLGALSATAVLLGVSWIFWVSQSVRINNVHARNSYSDVLVQNFPLTDRVKIDWWLANQRFLKEEYNIPQSYYDGSFNILFWAWDGVYCVDHGTDEDSDLLCFEDMQTKANCIVKSDVPLEVARLSDGSYRFYIGKRRYSQAKEGDEPRRRRDWEEAEKEAWERSKEESRKLNESSRTQAQ